VTAALTEIVQILDSELNHAQIGDYSGAKNGLQLENSGQIKQVYCAVDANALTVRAAAQSQSSLLLVHHGIGWNELCPVTGGRYQWLKEAIESDLAIYSSHLPLDAHPQLGNNVHLAQKLGFPDSQPYFEEKNCQIGRQIHSEISRAELVDRIDRELGKQPHLIGAGPENCQRIALITGGGGNLIHQVAADGFDTLISGEGNHWTFSAAHEYGMNLILGGHYLTETYGVKALGSYLDEKFKLPWSFIDEPSGL